jgi:hypothetical protein
MRQLYLLPLCCWLAGATTAAAQDTYKIKIKQPTAGVPYLVDKHEVQTVSAMTKGKPEDKPSKSVTVVDMNYKETVLKEKDGKLLPVPLNRHYLKAEINRDGKKETLVYDGKVVIIDKVKDKYVFKILGGKEITGKEAELLIQEFAPGNPPSWETEAPLLPKQPVKVDEIWKPDLKPFMEQLTKSSGWEMDPAKCSGTGKLIKAYKKGDRQFGVIEMHLEFVPSWFNVPGGKKIPAPAGNKINLNWTMDTCIDGSALEAGGDVHLQMDAVLPVGKDGKDQATMKLENQAKVKISEIQGK